MKIMDMLFKICNTMIPEHKNYIYASPHTNGRKDLYDLINNSSDNLLTLINSLINKKNDLNIVIYLECFSRKRMKKIREYIYARKNKNVEVIPFLSAQLEDEQSSHFFRKIKNRLIRYKCQIWMSDSGYVRFTDKVRNQKYICLNYSTPFKLAVNIDEKFNFSNIDDYVETSLLTACVHSAEFKVNFNNCRMIGFPRNDNLLVNNKLNIVRSWISSQVDFEYEHIIVYAPTFREYDGAYDKKCVFGYIDDNHELEKFLTDNKILVIVKFHPWQKTEEVIFSPHTLCYTETYDFSLYDVLALSDILVSDYSSVIHDYILRDKKVILNLFDYEQYKDCRGFAFDPVEYICPGEICQTLLELEKSILNSIKDEKLSEKHIQVRKIFHKYIDSKSTERAINLLKEYLN